MGEVAEKIARYGLELVDQLTSGPLVAGSSVSVPAQPDAVVFQSTRSRWAFERLDGSSPVQISVDAQHYLPTILVTGTPPFAALPASGPGPLVQVLMVPRTGYPFPPTLTRVGGQVLFQATPTSLYEPATDALIRVTPRHRNTIDPSAPLHSGPHLFTRTADDGQYTMWFLPDPSVPPDYERVPSRCRVRATVVLTTPPGPVDRQFSQNIAQNQTTGLQTLTIPPMP